MTNPYNRARDQPTPPFDIARAIADDTFDAQLGSWRASMVSVIRDRAEADERYAQTGAFSHVVMVNKAINATKLEAMKIRDDLDSDE